MKVKLIFRIKNFFLLFLINNKKNKIILINININHNQIFFHLKNKTNILKLQHVLLINSKNNLIIFI